MMRILGRILCDFFTINFFAFFLWIIFFLKKWDFLKWDFLIWDFILTPVLTRLNIIRSFRARVSPCFILIRFLSKHFMAYILPVSAFRHPYTSPKPPRPMIRCTEKSFIVNCGREKGKIKRIIFYKGIFRESRTQYRYSHFPFLRTRNDSLWLSASFVILRKIPIIIKNRREKFSTGK